MKYQRTSLVVSLGFVLATIASASPSPEKILSDAVAACKALKSLKYSVTATAGDMRLKADVFLANAKVPDSGFAPGLYFVKGKIDDGTNIEFAYDGSSLRIREDNGSVRKLENPTPYDAGRQLPQEAVYVLVPVPGDGLEQLMKEKPTLTYLRESKVGDWKCDVVEVKRTVSNPTLGQVTVSAEWAFDRETHLPVQRTSSYGSVTVTNLTVNPMLDESVFRLEGKEVIANPQGPQTDKLLQVGSMAPNFTLKDAAGKAWSLKDLKGKVVLIDFWGTWCVPCRKTMPILQKLHAKYGSKGLIVLGISVADKEADPAAFMRRMKLSYTTLVDGDSAAKAYKAVMLPTLYAIDKNGKVAFRQAGVGQDDEAQLTKIVEQLLSQAKK